jgi:long-chain acyl-CoA synthetase
MGVHDFTFYQVINRNAIVFKEKNAWFEAENQRSVTFCEYKEKVACLARGLQEVGLAKGDRIGILGKNGLEYFLINGAAAGLGAIVLPINWRLSVKEVENNFRDCQPKIVFVGEEFQETIKPIRDYLPFVEKYFNLDSRKGSFRPFDSLLDYGDEFLPAEVSADDGFIIIHTSAVEGKPRGALLTHRNALCAGMLLNHVLNLTPRDVNLNLLPFFHVGGLFIAMSAFQAGALNISVSRFDAIESSELIEEKKVSVMIVFPPILKSILEEYEKTSMNVSSLKAIGGLESVEVIEKYQRITGGTFYCMYGQTETSGLVSLGAYNDKPGSVGKILPLTVVQLVDDDDRPVPVGHVGEICVKGPLVFRGYWNLPQTTAWTFREGWHHTGDLGRFDEGGSLWYAGRKADKDLIKPGGENVYPAEVEKVILDHPAVERAVVIGVPDPKWGEGIKAVCQLKEGNSIEAQTLIDFVGRQIARYKKPHYVEFVKDFPLREDGSCDRGKIRKLYGGSQ